MQWKIDELEGIKYNKGNEERIMSATVSLPTVESENRDDYKKIPI
jgi:hypothetical protein